MDRLFNTISVLSCGGCCRRTVPRHLIGEGVPLVSAYDIGPRQKSFHLRRLEPVPEWRSLLV